MIRTEKGALLAFAIVMIAGKVLADWFIGVFGLEAAVLLLGLAFFSCLLVVLLIIRSKTY